MNKKPWLVPGVPFKTEGAFLTWVRGVLRRGWKVHPVKIEYLNSRKKRIKNTNPKSMKTHPQIWGCECEQCHKDVRFTEIEVDHAGEVQGTFTSMDDIQSYAEHLFMVDFDSLQTVCIPCHKIRTLAQKMGVTFDEAALEKDIIEICKKPVKQIVAFCEDYGYDASMLSNPTKRRDAVTKILKGIK
ncbi:MAG: hypothetical protein ACXW1D_00860 [Halobacteriota archaeon]